MNKDKYVFAQLVGFLDNFKFLRIVKKYEGDKYIKSYTCWNQLLTMMFGQLQLIFVRCSNVYSTAFLDILAFRMSIIVLL